MVPACGRRMSGGCDAGCKGQAPSQNKPVAQGKSAPGDKPAAPSGPRQIPVTVGPAAAAAAVPAAAAPMNVADAHVTGNVSPVSTGEQGQYASAAAATAAAATADQLAAMNIEGSAPTSMGGDVGGVNQVGDGTATDAVAEAGDGGSDKWEVLASEDVGEQQKAADNRMHE